jgi:glycosyltransferase involved in cell wall biosynthesis
VSEFEGASLSITEGMLHGLVPVLTRTPGGPPLARDGETALLAPVGDVRALAAHVLELERDDSLRLRLAGAAREAAVAYQRALAHAERFDAVVRAVAGTD